jgi:hypothetical protein
MNPIEHKTQSSHQESFKKALINARKKIKNIQKNSNSTEAEKAELPAWQQNLLVQQHLS